MALLITGGSGYIGSHTVLILLNNGYDVVVIDNLFNSSDKSLERVSTITNKNIVFYRGDIRDSFFIREVFEKNSIEAVIHFAGLKSVEESKRLPLEYYQNNVSGTLVLLAEMARAKVKKLIFSSSATVYGMPEFIPLTETAKLGEVTNPYGSSKRMVEKILEDFSNTDPDFSITALRYFNPVGAHPSGLIGEDPRGIPNNLLPYLMQVAIGKVSELSVYGNDYETKDGSGVRDYIHVIDLAEGHICALNCMSEKGGFRIYNLGTGIGYSVFDIIREFELISGKKVPYQVVDRRPGDIGECWSDPSLAYQKLEWKAKRGMGDILKDSWNWQIQNPNGYDNDKWC